MTFRARCGLPPLRHSRLDLCPISLRQSRRLRDAPPGKAAGAPPGGLWSQRKGQPWLQPGPLVGLWPWRAPSSAGLGTRPLLTPASVLQGWGGLAQFHGNGEAWLSFTGTGRPGSLHSTKLHAHLAGGMVRSVMPDQRLAYPGFLASVFPRAGGFNRFLTKIQSKH